MLAALLAGAVFAAVYPDDSYSRPRDDWWPVFETVTGVQPAGNPVQRLADYEHNELRAVEREGRPWCLWRFRARPERGAVLCFHDRLRRLPESLSVRVAYLGAEPLALVVSMPELKWWSTEEAPRDWVAQGDAEVPPGAEQVVTFPLDGLQPRFPTSLNLHVGAVLPDTDYELALREWTVHYPPAPGVLAQHITVPPTLRPGETAELEVAAAGVEPGRRVDLELRDEPRTLWRIRLTGGETAQLATGRAAVRRVVPEYLPARRLTAGMVVDGYRAAGAVAQCAVDGARQTEFPEVTRREHNGRPTAFVHGRPVTWGGYASYEFEPGNVGEFGASGANVMVVAAAAGRHVHQIAAPTWTAPDTFDFGQLDERVCMALGANPRADLLLRVSLAPPVFWLQEHTDSIARMRTPEGDVLWEETGCLAASIASEAWRAQQEACLRALIAHCSEQPWAERVIGFMPTGEVTEEWFAWGCNDGLWGDYSPANQAAFAAWCRERGQRWDSLPEPSERQCPGADLYPPTDAGRRAAAYAQYSSDLSADVIARFCRVIKEATGGRALAGTFHGYVVQLAGEPRQATAGQFALRRLLDCPDVDFIAGIPLHNFRTLANGYDLFTSATESILASGRLIVNENDLFSWLHHAIWHTPYDQQDPRGAAIAMHRRVLANTMVHGAELQWFSLLASWHSDPELQAEFAHQIAWQAEGVGFDRAPAEEIAFLIDDTSFAWRPPETGLPRTANVAALYALARGGAPVGVWLLSDADRLPERIKLAFVAESTAPRAEDLAALRRLIARGGRTIVLVGAPGLVDPAAQKWAEDGPARVTGLPLRVEPDGGPAIAGSGIAGLRPRCVGAQTGWAAYADGACAGLERPLAGEGRLIWCGQPPLDEPLLRSWVVAAGAHCYAPPGFTVHAARGLVAITAPGPAEAELAWPRPVTVRDLYTGWTGAGERLICPFGNGQTRLFEVRR